MQPFLSRRALFCPIAMPHGHACAEAQFAGSRDSLPPTRKTTFLRVISIIRRVRIHVVREGLWVPKFLRDAQENDRRNLLRAITKLWRWAPNDIPRWCSTCQMGLNVGQWHEHGRGAKHRRKLREAIEQEEAHRQIGFLNGIPLHAKK